MNDLTTEQAIQKSYETIQAYNARYLKAPPSPTWAALGDVVTHEKLAGGVLLRCANGLVEVIWTGEDVIRVRAQLGTDPFDEPFSYAVHNTGIQPPSLTINEDARNIVINTPNHVCYIQKSPFQIRLCSLSEKDEKTLCQAVQFAWADTGNVQAIFRLADDEACYGTGERAFHLNLRGRQLKLWNVDPGGYRRGDEPINYCTPFYLGVHNSGVYGILWDNSNRGFINLGADEKDQLIFHGEKGELRFYIFSGSSINTVLGHYTDLTGRIQLPPLWALGYHQCRYSYYPQEDVLNVANELRKRHIPCDAIYLDIHYMDGYRIFTWDKKGFPEFETMVEQLHQMGFKVVVIIDPGVKIDADYSVYQTGLAQDVFLKYPDGELAMGVVWPGACYFPDFGKAEARAWWVEQAGHILKTGIDGIWNDMNEPVIFLPDGPGEFPDYVLHDEEGRGGDHVTNHNVYGMLMGRASLEALRHHRPNKRSLNIIRAGYAGCQRFASSWTADNYSTWDDLRLSISMVLNLGLSGMSMTGPDVGGFAGDTTAELLTRWTQAASLLPFYRNHSAVDTIRQEPWLFGEPYERICREAIERRYRFLPYLYSRVAECHFYGWPVVQPLFSLDPCDNALRDIDDCYLVGQQVLVAPIMHRQRIRRNVYLPKDNWYDYYTGEIYSGGKDYLIKAPLDTLPIFVRTGTILPQWPVMQHTQAQPIESLSLRIYVGDGQSRLYEDEGDGFGFEKGAYRWTTFTSEFNDEALKITRQTEGEYTPPYRAFDLHIFGLDAPPQRIEVDGRKLEDWHYEAGIVSLQLEDFAQLNIYRHGATTQKRKPRTKKA